MQDDMTMVAIPSALYARIASLLPRLGQDSVEGFIAHAARTALAAVEAAVVSTDEEAAIVDRLRRLGYID
jgi:hypothetical protein